MRKKIASQFRKPGGILGKIISFLMVKLNRTAIEKLIKTLSIKDGDRLFEIGYGPGVAANIILSGFRSCCIIGIDFSELMYKKASKRNRQFIEQKRMNLLFGDFLETDINAKDFDIVYCANVVYFWDNIQKPFEKIKSLLKSGGVFCFYMASADDLNKIKFTQGEIFNKHSINQVLDALKQSGFGQIDHYYDKGYFIKATA
jgi:ubiquinone/menaquinone biosynthesis C-methylase UbiE